MCARDAPPEKAEIGQCGVVPGGTGRDSTASFALCVDSASLRRKFLRGMAVIYLFFALRRAAQYFLILSETALRSAALIFFRPRRFPVEAADNEAGSVDKPRFRPRLCGKLPLNI